MDYLAAATAAGLIGFDPVGAFVAVAAISLGASRRALAVLVAAYLVVIAALGTAVTVAVSTGLHAGDLDRYRPSARTLGRVEIVAGVALIVAGGVVALRARRHPSSSPDAADEAGESTGKGTRRLTARPLGLAVAGAGIAVSLLVDPGFLLLVAICTPRPAWTYPLAFAYWGAWSQILMLLVCAAVLLDRRRRLVGPLQRAVEALRARGRIVTAALLAILGIALTVDGLLRLGG